MTSEEILAYLEKNNALLTNRHFVYTSGKHGNAYVNMKAVVHDARWMQEVGKVLAESVKHMKPDVIVGPETTGRNLGAFVAAELNIPGVWCDVNDDGAEFSPKLDFGRLISGKRIVIVDDVLNVGSSIRKVVKAVEEKGGEVIGAAVIVRRMPEVKAENLNIPELVTLAEIVGGFQVFPPEDCEPCANKVSMTLRPGHGHEWIKEHPDYPVAK